MATIEIELIEVCREYGHLIIGLTHEGEPASGERLLLTLAGLESTFGKQREYARPEKGYMPGGKYYKDSPKLREEYKRFGVLAACSYGAWQIMYITAQEMGFKGHPADLQKDRICCYWATQLIVKRFIGRHKAKTLRDIFDGYNSGHAFDSITPQSYIDKGIKLYDSLKNL